MLGYIIGPDTIKKKERAARCTKLPLSARFRDGLDHLGPMIAGMQPCPAFLEVVVSTARNRTSWSDGYKFISYTKDPLQWLRHHYHPKEKGKNKDRPGVSC